MKDHIVVAIYDGHGWTETTVGVYGPYTKEEAKDLEKRMRAGGSRSVRVQKLRPYDEPKVEVLPSWKPGGSL